MRQEVSLSECIESDKPSSVFFACSAQVEMSPLCQVGSWCAGLPRLRTDPGNGGFTGAARHHGGPGDRAQVDDGGWPVAARIFGDHGCPVAFSSDKHSVFRPTQQNTKGMQSMTQFGRALASSTSNPVARTPARPRVACEPIAPCRTGWCPPRSRRRALSA